MLKLVDYFTAATCFPPAIPIEKFPTVFTSFDCALEQEKNRCITQGGSCNILRDGYYITNIICVILGVVTFWGYIKPAATRLSALPLRSWREYERI